MRKMSKKNKISFNIFGFVIVLTIGLLSFVSMQVFAIENEDYALKRNSTVFDYEMNAVQVPSDGTIKKKWTGDYYAQINDIGEYNLGSHSVVFESGNRSMMILGDGYQVFTDGTVLPIEKKTDINDLNEVKFYKLTDRKYLLIGSQISSKDEVIGTSKYLEITMDKSGNALLSNDEINYKTVKPIVLTCGNAEFDIANEKLIYQEEIVDLKKINGSTNEYVVPVDEQKSDDPNPPSSIVNGDATGGGGGGTGGSSTTGDNNQTGNSGNDVTDGSSGSNTNNDKNNGTTNKPNNLERSISIRGTSTSVNSITVDYQIVDVENKFVATYLILEDLQNDATTRYGVNKADSSITLRGLAASSQYKVYLHYEMYMLDKDKVNTLTENTAGVVKVRTKNIQSTVNIDRISSTKLNFTVTTDSQYILDSASLVLYVDGIKKETKNIDIAKSIDNGWTGSFAIDGGSVFKLVIEGAMFNGDPITLNAQCTSRVSNSTESFVQSLLNWFK